MYAPPPCHIQAKREDPIGAESKRSGDATAGGAPIEAMGSRHSNDHREALTYCAQERMWGHNTVSEFPIGALGWLHAASIYVIRCVGVDVAVLEVDRTRRDVDATALPDTSKRENPMEAMGIYAFKWLRIAHTDCAQT